jgi:hypothetical protein
MEERFSNKNPAILSDAVAQGRRQDAAIDFPHAMTPFRNFHRARWAQITTICYWRIERCLGKQEKVHPFPSCGPKAATFADVFAPPG